MELHGKPADPYRIFFPLGIVLGAMGVSIWPLYYFGITEGYSGRAHAFVQTIVTQIVKSVRPPDTTRAKMNGTFGDGSFNLGGARVLTVKSFLSANAIRATDSLDYDKIDWCTSNNSVRSEEHTSELQSRGHLVCRLLLEKKKSY